MNESRTALSKALKVKSQRSTPEVESVDDDSGSESEDGAAFGAAADEPPAWAKGMMAQMAHFQAELFKLKTKKHGAASKDKEEPKRKKKHEDKKSKKKQEGAPGCVFHFHCSNGMSYSDNESE